jgi:hypothetical protein
MKKTLIALVVFIIFAIVSVYYFEFASEIWTFGRTTSTPKQFLNRAYPGDDKYQKDKIEIVNKLKKDLLDSEDFFDNSAYFDGTEILVDTIVYSPDFAKLGIIVLTKNPTSRQLIPDRRGSFYFDGTSYVGIREKDSLNLTWLGPNFSNSIDKGDLSNMLRQKIFRHFITVDSTGPFAQKYNLNDIRFWTSNVWQQVEEKKARKKAFEIEKREHPENVYEPPKKNKAKSTIRQ